MTPSLPERYVMEHGDYVLYVGQARVLVTRAVAVLIDTRLGTLITHGDPASVRRELDEMRQVLLVSCAPHYDKDWLLLEGRPHLEGLNAVLCNSGDIHDLKDAYAGDAARIALALTRALIARISRHKG